VAGGEADALNARHIVYVMQEVGEGPSSPPTAVIRHAWQIAAIGINILA